MADTRTVVVAVVTALLTGGLTYYWTRKAKVDEVRIAKVHELVQKLAVSIQMVHLSNEHLADWFRLNFKNMDSVQEGVARFRQYSQGLYAAEAAEVERLELEKRALGELLLKAKVYLAKGLCDDLEAYMSSCGFSWSNVWPLFDTYAEGLFENLLDDEKIAQRKRLAERILKELRKAAG